jgi:LPXTG-site transpeptidase (sortase) family protein
MTTLAIILFVCGLGVAGLQLKTNQQVKAQVKTLAAETSAATGDGSASDIPSEEKPDGSVGTYKVAPTSPRVLRIGKINVEARVIRLGIKADNEIKSPANIYDAGWYEGSSLPGETGAVLIDGHVHGPTTPGVFVNLKKMVAGDTISLERGDGKKFTYKVVRTQSYDVDKVDMGAAFSSAQPGKPGLNIITCDGSYDDAGNYGKRLIVFAVQM